MDYYREHYPASLRTRKTEDGGIEETFDGADNIPSFRLPKDSKAREVTSSRSPWQTSKVITGHKTQSIFDTSSVK